MLLLHSGTCNTVNVQRTQDCDWHNQPQQLTVRELIRLAQAKETKSVTHWLAADWLVTHKSWVIVTITILTSCRRAAATICPRPGLQVVTRYTSCTHMDRSPLLYVHVGLPVQPIKAAWWPWPRKWCPSTCDVCYLCVNFSLPRPLCSRITPDVRDRQTSDKSIA